MEYITVFELYDTGYNWLPAIIGLIFTLAGVVGLRNKKFAKAIKPHPVIPLILGPMVCIGAMWFQYNNRQYYEQLLTQNKAWIIEGVVENFQTWPRGDHGAETFTVNHVRFSYANASTTPAFHTTQAYGGPIHEGLYVRIYYTDSHEFDGTLAILRIETRR